MRFRNNRRAHASRYWIKMSRELRADPACTHIAGLLTPSWLRSAFADWPRRMWRRG